MTGVSPEIQQVAHALVLWTNTEDDVMPSWAIQEATGIEWVTLYATLSRMVEARIVERVGRPGAGYRLTDDGRALVK